MVIKNHSQISLTSSYLIWISIIFWLLLVFNYVLLGTQSRAHATFFDMTLGHHTNTNQTTMTIIIAHVTCNINSMPIILIPRSRLISLRDYQIRPS